MQRFNSNSALFAALDDCVRNTWRKGVFISSFLLLHFAQKHSFDLFEVMAPLSCLLMIFPWNLHETYTDLVWGGISLLVLGRFSPHGCFRSLQDFIIVIDMKLHHFHQQRFVHIISTMVLWYSFQSIESSIFY